MYKEIDLGEKNRLIFFSNINFWEDMLSSVTQDSEFLDIITYNFNFQYK